MKRQPCARTLAVIVACYDIAPFLERCLRSIFQQPQVHRLQVIIVDDGSTDGTAELCEAVMAEHPHVHCELVRQSNQGVSAARNSGLRRVRTPYLTFVDGDDEWSGDFLSHTLPLMDRARADIIGFNAAIVDLQGLSIGELRCHATLSAPGPTDVAAEVARLGEWQAWTRIYKSELFDSVRFPPGRLYEDAATVPQLYARARHIEVLPHFLYRYRRRPGSITSHVSDRHIGDLLQNAQEAAARRLADPVFWDAVHRNMLLHLARQIGRAPASARRAMLARGWPAVRQHSGSWVAAQWLLTLLNTALRTEARRMLERLKAQPRNSRPISSRSP